MQSALAQPPRIIGEFAKPRFATFFKYGKVPKPSRDLKGYWPSLQACSVCNHPQMDNTPNKGARVNTLVATDVICWFLIAECIGKGSLVAYKV